MIPPNENSNGNAARERDAKGESRVTTKTRVLLVEDDAQLGTLLEEELTQEGYQCNWLRTADEVMSVVHGFKPSVILLDLMLPDGSGYDLLASIRSVSNAPVIVISARILGEDKVRALDLGADDYVTKPFWITELSARIRAVLRRNSQVPMQSNRLNVETISINFSSREVLRDGDYLALTPTEFGLLEFFVRRPKQAFSRDEIIDAVFTNPASASEALQTHISRLRKKLGPTGKRIKTVWGMGYRFDPPEIAS